MKLTYFDIYAKAEATRMLLTHAKVDFEDCRIQFPEMAAMKPDLEFGQLPLFEHDGKKMSQSNSILRFVGKTYGYFPADHYQQYLVESTQDAVDDLYMKLVKFHFEKNEETKKVLKEEAIKFLTIFVGAFEKRLLANTSQKHLVGDKMTVADFAFAGLAFSAFENEAHPLVTDLKPIVEANPVVSAYIAHLKEDLKEYLATRPPRPF